MTPENTGPPDDLTVRILSALDGALEPAELEALAYEISRRPDSRDSYVEIMAVHALLRQSRGYMAGLLTEDDTRLAALSASAFRDTIDQDLQNQAMRQALKSPAPPDRPTSASYRRRRPETGEIHRFIRRTAAIILLCLGVFWFDRWVMTSVPASREPLAIAHLTDSRQARWGNPPTPSTSGIEFLNRSYRLLEGWAAIRLNDGAELLLQAPVSLDFETANQIYLKSGRLTARVPAGAQGFTVRSPFYSVVDYGTEFGVQVSDHGDMETHVFKGQIEIRSGSNPLVFDQSQRLTAGTAGLADQNGTITVADAALRPRFFMQDLPASATLALPGRRLDLADMIGGGNGLGNGRPHWAIDPLTGQSGPKPRYFSSDNLDPLTGEKVTGKGRVPQTRFCPVTDNPLIDSVVVPRGNGLVPISTTGLFFAECPPCLGDYFQQITNSNPLSKPLRLSGVDYGTTQHPGFYMHASTGLTFDLVAIRQMLASTVPCRFQAQFGINDNPTTEEEVSGNRVTLYLLVDGAVRFTQQIDGIGAHPVSVELNPTDRFMTLFVHDGGDGTGGDRCIFGEPVLLLKPVY